MPQPFCCYGVVAPACYSLLSSAQARRVAVYLITLMQTSSAAQGAPQNSEKNSTEQQNSESPVGLAR